MVSEDREDHNLFSESHPVDDSFILLRGGPFKQENNLAVVLTHPENGESDSMAGVSVRP